MSNQMTNPIESLARKLFELNDKTPLGLTPPEYESTIRAHLSTLAGVETKCTCDLYGESPSGPDQWCPWHGQDAQTLEPFLFALAARDAEIANYRTAIQAQVDNIERWLETGEPATAEESKVIYTRLKDALL